MQYRTLGKTGIRASAVAFGGIMVNKMEQGGANRLVASAVERGVNYFDVAPTYGEAQYVLGPALAPYRSKVFLACKSDKKTAADIRLELEESLKALKTDHFDVYQLHCCDGEFGTVFGPGGAMEALVRAREAGKVRFIGFSSHREISALYLMGMFDFDTIMQPVNWATNLTNAKSDLALDVAARKGMGLIAIKTLAHRLLREGEPNFYPNCWYMPVTDDERLAELAMKFTLSKVHIAISPGAAPMLELMLKLIGRPGILEAPDEEGMRYLKAEAAAAGALFPD